MLADHFYYFLIDGKLSIVYIVFIYLFIALLKFFFLTSFNVLRR